MKNFFLLIFNLFFFVSTFGQTPLYFDNCETTGFNWKATFSGPNTSYVTGISSLLDVPANVPLYVSPTTSILHQGAGNAGSGPERIIINLPTVSLNPNIAYCFKMKFASIGFNNNLNTGAGVDNQDYLRLNVSYNGSSTYSPEIQVNGGNNTVWSYNTSNSIYRTAQGAFSNYAQVLGSEYSSLTLELPLGTSQVGFEIDLSLNAVGESWLIDDMQIFSSCYSPLPIELNYFKGIFENNYVKLEWETLSEKNNDFFKIYCSDDLITETFITDVDAIGNSNIPQYYSYFDYNPKTFYKLCQVDFDGQSKCFDWIYVQNFSKQDQLIKIFDVLGRSTSIQKNNLIFIMNEKGNFKKIVFTD